MTEPEQIALVRLARTPGVGPVTYRRLLHRFGSGAEALRGLPEVAQAAGRRSPVAVPGEGVVERELERLRKLGGRMLVLGGPGYPAPLAMLEDAPPVLAVLGDPAALSRRCIGLVGARNASANGRRMAEALAADLAAQGMVVVSGLARGVDTAAHEGALHMGRTVAAVAGGLDVPYPPENAGLMQRIADRGAVVAEAPLGTAPQSRHFPRRNRVIAGLSEGLVVVEAARHSGSLITAEAALDAHRLVMAVPGTPLEPRCQGCNDLIRGGATLVGDAAQVLEALAEFRPPEPRLPGLEEERDAFVVHAAAPEARSDVLRLLGPEATDIDDLVRRSHLSASVVMTVVLGLELDGVVETLPGHRVALIA